MSGLSGPVRKNPILRIFANVPVSLLWRCTTVKLSDLRSNAKLQAVLPLHETTSVTEMHLLIVTTVNLRSQRTKALILLLRLLPIAPHRVNGTNHVSKRTVRRFILFASVTTPRLRRRRNYSRIITTKRRRRNPSVLQTARLILMKFKPGTVAIAFY